VSAPPIHSDEAVVFSAFAAGEDVALLAVLLAKSSVLLLPTALAAKILLPVIPSLIAMFIEEDAADDAVPFIA